MDKDNRATMAGITIGKAVIEMVHLMYQNNTASNFLEGLILTLNNELTRRRQEKGK